MWIQSKLRSFHLNLLPCFEICVSSSQLQRQTNVLSHDIKSFVIAETSYKLRTKAFRLLYSLSSSVKKVEWSHVANYFSVVFSYDWCVLVHSHWCISNFDINPTSRQLVYEHYTGLRGHGCNLLIIVLNNLSYYLRKKLLLSTSNKSMRWKTPSFSRNSCSVM